MNYQTFKEFIPSNPVHTLLNGLTTPDGTMLVSYYRHDYKEYTDKNGKWYMIDGGRDYTHCSANGDEYHWKVTTDDDYETIRQFVGRGGYGKNRRGDYRYTPLAKMSDAYLVAAVEWAEKNDQSTLLLKTEQAFRKHYNVIINENI